MHSATPEILFPLRIISDLHLGHDICEVTDVRQLAPLLEGVRMVIFNGDTLEHCVPRFLPASQRLTDALLALCQELGVTPIFLNGNHDPASWRHDAVTLFGGKLVIHHGHAFFPDISPWSAKLKYCRHVLEGIWAEYSEERRRQVDTLYEITRRCSLAMLSTDVKQRGTSFWAKMEMAVKELWPPRRPIMVAWVWLTLPSIATRFLEAFYPQAEVFVCGHTHRAAFWRRKRRLLVNTGGFVSFASPLVGDVAEDGLITLRRTRRDAGTGNYRLAACAKQWRIS